MTRSALLGAGTAVALVGLPLMTRFVEAAQALDKHDIATLNAAIELERAGIKTYQDAAGTGLMAPAVMQVATGFIADHTAHRDALIAAVVAGGGTPSSGTVKLEYPALKSQADILRFAKSVEVKAASTYLSIISEFKNRDLATIAGSILGIETTHVAILASALGEPRAYPTAFIV